MTIIKIHLYRHQSSTEQKYLLTYIPEIHKTVGCFIEFAINALQIENCSRDDLIVENDGYTMPQCLDCKVIENMQVLTIKVKTNDRRKIQSPASVAIWTAKKAIEEERKQNSVDSGLNLNGMMEEEDQHSEQSTPKFSEDGIMKDKRENVSKKIIKQNQVKKAPTRTEHKEQRRKGKKVHVKSSSSEQVEEQAEEQSVEEVEVQVKKLPKKAQFTKGKKLNSFQKKSVSQSEQQEASESGIQSSSESSQSSQEELPRVIRTKKAQLQQKLNSKKHEQEKPKVIEKKTTDKHTEVPQEKTKKQAQIVEQYQSEEEPMKPTVKQLRALQQQQQKQKQKQKLKPVTYAQRKKLIDADDIESSDSSSNEEDKKIIMNKGLLQAQKQSSSSKSPQRQATMLPPSLRNKAQQKPASAFKTHQLQQWLPVTKQLLTRHKATLPLTQQQTPFLKPNNLIKFKQIELDEEKFIPKQSEWIQATVGSVDTDGRLRLSKVTQLDKQYRERYQVYEYNMCVLEVNRNYLTQGQREVVGEGEGKVDKQDDGISKTQVNENVLPPSQQQNNQPEQSQQKNSLQKFICGQVNFYFGDKNYPFDLFMQMHANKHPEKYIPIRFLLNFPKIKKVLKDQNKLLEYLVEDCKRAERNFELDEERRLVRKKIVGKVNRDEQNGENQHNTEQIPTTNSDNLQQQ